MMSSRETTRSEDEMIRAGERFGRLLGEGDVVALNGRLGAGKTHFTKGIVRAFGGGDEVTSPTFSLVNEYRDGRLPVFHFDFYRIDDLREVLRIGWEEYLDEPGVIVVEWAEKFPELLPPSTRIVQLAIEEDGAHSILIV